MFALTNVRVSDPPVAPGPSSTVYPVLNVGACTGAFVDSFTQQTNLAPVTDGGGGLPGPLCLIFDPQHTEGSMVCFIHGIPADPDWGAFDLDVTAGGAPVALNVRAEVAAAGGADTATFHGTLAGGTDRDRGGLVARRVHWTDGPLVACRDGVRRPAFRSKQAVLADVAPLRITLSVEPDTLTDILPIASLRLQYAPMQTR